MWKHFQLHSLRNQISLNISRNYLSQTHPNARLCRSGSNEGNTLSLGVLCVIDCVVFVCTILTLMMSIAERIQATEICALLHPTYSKDYAVFWNCYWTWNWSWLDILEANGRWSALCPEVYQAEWEGTQDCAQSHWETGSSIENERPHRKNVFQVYQQGWSIVP